MDEPELVVIDKESGGCKSHAANAGINAAAGVLVLVIDDDTMLEPDDRCPRYLATPSPPLPHWPASQLASLSCAARRVAPVRCCRQARGGVPERRCLAAVPARPRPGDPIRGCRA